MLGPHLQSALKAASVAAAALAIALTFASSSYAAGTRHTQSPSYPSHSAYPASPSAQARYPTVNDLNRSSVCVNGYRYLERPSIAGDDDPDAASVPLRCH
jgi:hypothetical protein